MRPVACLPALLLLLGCDAPPPATDGGARDAGAQDAGPAPLPSTLGGSERPATLVVPAAYDGETALPVVVLLHGFGARGALQDTYLGLSRETRRRGFYLIIPDGTVNGDGRRFWNATPACCDFEGSGVDDVTYLMGLVRELEALAPVSDLFFVGHSNGGFMSYRMACEHAERVSAIVSLAGSGFATEAECGASRPVSVLQIHGDADDTVPYTGGPGGAYPSAPDLVARWAARAGCATPPEMGAPLDLDSTLAGEETTVLRYARGCTGAEAELWTIVGGGHIPAVTRSFSATVLDWLMAHGR